MLASFIEEGPFMTDGSESAGMKKNFAFKNQTRFGTNNSGMYNKSKNLPQIAELGSLVGRDSFLKNSFKFDKNSKEEKIVQEYFNMNIGKSLESIIDQLENSDYIINFASLRDLFHRKGVNMRFEWVVFAKLKRQRIKILVGADILSRCIKDALDHKTSKRLKYFKKQAVVEQPDQATQKKKMEELIQDKTDFLMEDFYKKLLCLYTNALIRDNSEVYLK